MLFWGLEFGAKQTDNLIDDAVIKLVKSADKGDAEQMVHQMLQPPRIQTQTGSQKIVERKENEPGSQCVGDEILLEKVNFGPYQRCQQKCDRYQAQVDKDGPRKVHTPPCLAPV